MHGGSENENTSDQSESFVCLLDGCSFWKSATDKNNLALEMNKHIWAFHSAYKHIEEQRRTTHCLTLIFLLNEQGKPNKN